MLIFKYCSELCENCGYFLFFVDEKSLSFHLIALTSLQTPPFEIRQNKLLRFTDSDIILSFMWPF